MPLIHERALRGHTVGGWLDSFHTFSFGGFNDPSRMGFRSLRVINEDRVIPGAGFGEHFHEDMEILTYVISGALRHEDSLGNGSTIRPGEIQRMSAGTGITHSEMNASDTDAVHFLQIWILPERSDLPPSYEQKTIAPADPSDPFTPIALPGGGPNAVALHQDASVFLVRLADGQEASRSFGAGRAGFLQVVDGMVSIDDERLVAGDGLQFDAVKTCTVTALSDCTLMLFDLA